MIWGLTTLLLVTKQVFPTRYNGESLPPTVFNISSNEGYRFGPSELYSSRTFGEVKHMEVYERNQDYLLILANRSLWLSSRETSQEFYNDLVDSSYVTQTLNSLLGPLELKTFFQIDSSRIILVYSNIYCLVLLQPDVDPKISVYLGDCTQSGTIDGNEGTVRFSSIVAVAGEARNRSVAFILQQEGTIRELTLDNHAIRTIHGRDNQLRGAESMTFNSYNNSLVISSKLFFIEFELSSKSTRIIWRSPEFSNILDHSDLLAAPSKRTNGYALKGDILAMINKLLGTVDILDIKNQELYSYCLYDTEGHPSPNAPTSFLYVGENLFVGSKGSIHSTPVIPVNYCGSDYGWVSEDEYPRELKYSGASPLAPGTYTYQVSKEKTWCVTKIILSKTANISEPSVCVRVTIIELNETVDSTDVEIFDGHFLALSQGTTYFINKALGLCGARFTLRHVNHVTDITSASNRTGYAVRTTHDMDSHSETSVTRGSESDDPNLLVVIVIIIMAVVAVVTVLSCILLIIKRQNIIAAYSQHTKKRVTRPSPVTTNSHDPTLNISSKESSRSKDRFSLPSTKSVQNQQTSGLSLPNHISVEFIKEESILYKRMKLRHKV